MTFDYDASFLDSAPDNEAWPLDSEFAKARPRPGPVLPASGRPLSQPRPPAAGATGNTGNFVTQAQLDAAMARARGEIVANANAIKTVDGRVRTVIGDMQKLQSSTKKDIEKLRGDLRTTQTLSAMIPLIAPPGSRFGAIAPLAHLIGPDLLSGSSSTSSGGSMLGNNNNLITIGALLFASGAFN
ncbi:MAG: hypothetical protein WCS20_16070 [Alphaproteobacteria bacterium]